MRQPFNGNTCRARLVPVASRCELPRSARLAPLPSSPLNVNAKATQAAPLGLAHTARAPHSTHAYDVNAIVRAAIDTRQALDLAALQLDQLNACHRQGAIGAAVWTEKQARRHIVEARKHVAEVLDALAVRDTLSGR